MTTGAPITVNLLADSITDGGHRLTTAEWTYPRCIHAEIMTHGALRRNSASSRAIPAAALRRSILTAPFIPAHWGQNQKGMQAAGEVDDTAAAEAWWLRARDSAALLHEEGELKGLHKQVVNRIIEPWMMITIIISGTDWANFFHLRKHKDAEPHFQKLASLMWDAYHSNMPVFRAPGDWHLPMADDAETIADARRHAPTVAPLDTLKQISTGRCARVSYLTHHGVRDVAEDVALHDRLIQNGKDGGPMHMSPFEHPAMAVAGGQRIGPFTGWKSYRKFFVGEAGPDTSGKCHACGCWAGRHVMGCPSA